MSGPLSRYQCGYTERRCSAVLSTTTSRHFQSWTRGGSTPFLSWSRTRSTIFQWHETVTQKLCFGYRKQPASMAAGERLMYHCVSKSSLHNSFSLTLASQNLLAFVLYNISALSYLPRARTSAPRRSQATLLYCFSLRCSRPSWFVSPTHQSGVTSHYSVWSQARCHLPGAADAVYIHYFLLLSLGSTVSWHCFLSTRCSQRRCKCVPGSCKGFSSQIRRSSSSAPAGQY